MVESLAANVSHETLDLEPHKAVVEKEGREHVLDLISRGIVRLEIILSNFNKTAKFKLKQTFHISKQNYKESKQLITTTLPLKIIV